MILLNKNNSHDKDENLKIIPNPIIQKVLQFTLAIIMLGIFLGT